MKSSDSPSPNFHEPLVTLGAIGAPTKRIALAAGIMILPLRDPIMLARQVSTVDEYSQARIILAVGLGSYREEFSAMSPQLSSHSRGDLMIEALKALRLLFSESCASFHGKFTSFEEVALNPKPKQNPYQLYLGGNAVPVLEPVAGYGSGWLTATLSPDKLARGINYLQTSLKRHGREFSNIEIAPELVVSISKSDWEDRENFESGVYRHFLSLRRSTLKH